MHFEGRRKTSRMPNLTPLIDVVFLLLVFFMLTSHFMHEEAIPLSLPTAESGTPLTDDTLQVVLDSGGRILLGGEVIGPEALEGRLRQELQSRTNKKIRLRGDRVASLGSTVNVLDAARKGGANGVDIVTQEQ
jgi:biopolymer transport protein ExbD